MKEDKEHKAFPFDVGMQKMVLAWMCRSIRFMASVCSSLEPKCFTNVYLQIIASISQVYFLRYKKLILPEYLYDLASKYLEKDDRLDEIELTQHIRDLFQVSLPDSDDYLLERTHRFLQLRRLERTLSDSVNRLREEWDEFEIGKCKAEILRSCADNLGSLVLYNHQESLRERLDNLAIEKETGIKTVVCPQLDKSTDGGMRKGELLTVIGPTGKGKTLILVNFAKGGLILGKKVLYVTCETSAEVICQRMDSSISGMTRSDIRHNPERMRQILDRYYSTFPGGALYVAQYPSGAATVETIEGLLNDLRIQHSFSPEILLVDYADLLKPSYQQQQRRFELTQIYTDIRGLCVSYGLAGFTASQSNRLSYFEEVIDVQHVAEDIGKAQISDIILTLNQTKQERERDPEVMRFFVAKNRNNPAYFTIPFEVYKGTMQIKPPSSPLAAIQLKDKIKKALPT